ncbi:BZ3500_MvSof-1268-A1-R1_Chr7-1g09152 [Microbotryum saponariae]|uniref:Protein arginine methyltransferase NDUFAF7 n=1 Tax=Microbotryum saponariae TaxID=289078 RepID=A0A2X0NCC5_9BASI|nr:BZ3501_MvSof-1269-A2-R1_Chr7-1g08857 [Microbotryum saponariae]SDA02896.1 BZ3500_MvSof-1268-A1-R1_Chr7-1g09152 [Microbotryum saponariae]
MSPRAAASLNRALIRALTRATHGSITSSCKTRSCRHNIDTSISRRSFVSYAIPLRKHHRAQPAATVKATTTSISEPTDSIQGSQYAPAELLTVLQETIKTHGPLPVSRYMTLCLSHPTLGYYTTRNVFGSSGDFITSPEISQVFGELLAIWFVTQWAAQGAPSNVRIVELGPGKGTLLADVLRTFKALPQASARPVTSIHLVESSAALRKVQKEKLVNSGFADVETRWWDNAVEIPPSEDEFTIVIAHEFFDALPIHIFENTPKGWREVLVDVADSKKAVVPNVPVEPLRLVLAPGPTPASTLYTRLSTVIDNPALSASTSSALSFDTTLPPTGATSPSTAQAPQNVIEPISSPTLARFARLPIGSRIEISPASWEVAQSVGKLFSPSSSPKGAAGLVIDYGDAKAFGRSWRGFRKHAVVDPLTKPGHTDLTANVDFAYLNEALAEDASTHGPLSQRTFLRSLGLDARISSLLRHAPMERQKEIASAAQRLIDKAGMGTQYKVMAITPKGNQEGTAFPFVEGVEEALDQAERAS